MGDAGGARAGGRAGRPHLNPVCGELVSSRGAGGVGGLARGHGVGLRAFGGAFWPLAAAHSDPLWVQTCFGRVNGAPG